MGVSACNPQNVFTNWLARNIPWTSYFWNHVFHIKIYKPRKYLSIPQVVINICSLDCYWCIRWWDQQRRRNSKWGLNNKITPQPTGNIKLTMYLVIIIVALLKMYVISHHHTPKQVRLHIQLFKQGRNIHSD